MRVFFFLSFLLLLIGCQEEVKPVEEKVIVMPAWINNPNLSGARGAVGSCGPHFKGPTYQRSLAISRALDELAMEMGVQVHISTKLEEVANGDNVTAKSKVNAEQTVNNQSVSAHIEATFTDPRTNELFVWMVLN